MPRVANHAGACRNVIGLQEYRGATTIFGHGYLDSWPKPLSVLIFLISLVVTALLIVPIRIVALSIGLVDKPGMRKHHRGEVPLAGGVAILVSLMAQTFVLHHSAWILSLLLLGALMLIIGVLDDLKDIRPVVRLSIEFCVCLILIYWQGIAIWHLGPLFGSTPIIFSGIMVPLFTCFCIIGGVNSMNMIDGIDGLLASVALITLVAMAFLADRAGMATEALLCLLLAGGLGAFLLFNIRVFRLKLPVFMGDAGALMLGFLISALLITMTQGSRAAFEPVVAGWLLGLPLLDTISVMVRRVVSGHSPFKAGRDHFHHMLLDAGLSAGASLLVLVGIHAVMVAVGLLATISGLPEALYFWLFVVAVVAHFFATPPLLARVGVTRLTGDH